MATLKLFLNTQKINKTGQAPLYLRIIHNRKSRYISLAIYLKENEWDNVNRRVKKNHPNSTRLNKLIATKIAEAEDLILEMENAASSTAKDVQQHIKGKPKYSFYEYFDLYMKSIETRLKVPTIVSYRVFEKSIKDFEPKENLTFEDIDLQWLKRFSNWLRNMMGQNQNTADRRMKSLRRIFTSAIEDEIITPDKNPFLRYKIKKQYTEKQFLLEEEIEAIENLNLGTDERLILCRDLFIFAIYTGGLRRWDLLELKWKNIEGDKLVLKTHKTDSVVSIKLPMKSILILDKFRPVELDPDQFIFPYLKSENDHNPWKRYAEITNRGSIINRQLKRIACLAKVNKKLHLHIARHSFATLALRKGMRIEYVSKLMGHSDITTTQIYAKIMNEELDKAMEIFNS
ncbi:hypothetical protein C3K47_19160 [Solitalea longa]|uniref:Recombinase n=1 Tax=Solitalea longa TaxID=2079460 RepID=A0A2S4ZX89_9SPHI|nr:site-specific integrase [Solitalea longa]POY34669.1 hypothetical protein C3K47_19160 [Solitalea longa]